MAPQDYVSRSRTSAKKNTPYQKKTQEVIPGVPLKTKLISLFTLLGISVFGYALWTIKDNAAVPSTVIAPQHKPQKSADNALPEVPEEKWAYMNELKTKQVEISEYEVKQTGPYQMQCGSFRTEKQADRLKAQIAFTGLEATIKRSQGKKFLYYKVILGPYPRKRLAEKDKHKLKNNKVNHCVIWSWR